MSAPSVEDGSTIATRAGGGRTAASPRARRRRPMTRHRVTRAVVPYLYILPTMALFGVLVLYPFVQTAWLSLFKWDGIGPKEWVGFDNYRTIWDDPQVHQAFAHSFVLILFFSALPIAIALGLSATSMLAHVRGDGALRTMIFLPQVISTVVIGVIWSWILAPDGPLNQFLGAVGLGFLQHNWLGSLHLDAAVARARRRLGRDRPVRGAVRGRDPEDPALPVRRCQRRRRRPPARVPGGHPAVAAR